MSSNPTIMLNETDTSNENISESHRLINIKNDRNFEDQTVDKIDRVDESNSEMQEFGARYCDQWGQYENCLSSKSEVK